MTPSKIKKTIHWGTLLTNFKGIKGAKNPNPVFLGHPVYIYISTDDCIKHEK